MRTSSQRSRIRSQGVFSALLLALSLAAACSSSDSPPRHLVLVSFDTLRADHTSVGGYARETTPRLAALAAEGLVFEAAYAPSATTGPSHATLFTGTLPVTHGVVKNGLALGPELPTLAGVARAAGVQTAGFASSYVLDSRFGFHRGFDAWDDDFEPREATMAVSEWEGSAFEGAFDRRGDYTREAAIEWLRHTRDPDRPFFLFVHFMDAHDPYEAPPPFAGRFEEPGEAGGASSSEDADRIDRYDAEIAFADAQLGGLRDELESLGLLEDTLVVVTADHGEGLGDHGALYHGVHVYEAFVHVPLVLRFPAGRFAGTRVPTPVGLADLMPTLTSVMNWTGPFGAARVDLVADLAGSNGTEAERPVHFHRRHYAPRTIDGARVEGEKLGVRLGRWKYLEAKAEGTRELYDLEADPGEVSNLVERHPDVAARLALLVEAQRRWGGPRA